MQPQTSPSRARYIAGVVAAFVVAPWTFVGVCWLALAAASKSGKPLRDLPYFWPLAATTVTLAFVVAVVIAVLVMRWVRGRPMT
jgi:L-asparagine transporter-like permease